MSDRNYLKYFILLSFFLVFIMRIDAQDSTRTVMMKDSVYVERQASYSEETYTIYFRSGNITKKIFEQISEDGSSIDYVFTFSDCQSKYVCFAVNNNAFDGNQFLFFNKKNNHVYITPTCFAGFYPIKQPINFKNKKVILENTNLTKNPSLSIKNYRALTMSSCDNIKTVETNIIRIRYERN